MIRSGTGSTVSRWRRKDQEHRPAKSDLIRAGPEAREKLGLVPRAASEGRKGSKRSGSKLPL